ncbi:hypothetical protein [Spirulina sp. 06S082]|uniref:hypothetical protein n=1 Tax=Spirulina sp. 06S082 TaxID=3110248 RepID=UPI002B209AD0|nr:hypothetical protein [Spirulina sp. 06S082]MEA5467502.1 hypothetical protein [Spirulina sp. 06S082]
MKIVKPDMVCANFALKIKKWLNAVKQLRSDDLALALPITRLTSIKSLCLDKNAARSFALHISQRVLKQMQDSNVPENPNSREWQAHRTFACEVVGAIAQEENLEVLQQYLGKIARYKEQNKNLRGVHWTTVHFVRSGYLVKLEYALRCCTESDREIWGYKLAREYVERYSPVYGTGLIPDSIPFLLDIAEFWCRYYFDLSLSEKFSKVMAQIEGISLHECLTRKQVSSKSSSELLGLR